MCESCIHDLVQQKSREKYRNGIPKQVCTRLEVCVCVCVCAGAHGRGPLRAGAPVICALPVQTPDLLTAARLAQVILKMNAAGDKLYITRSVFTKGRPSSQEELKCFDLHTLFGFAINEHGTVRYLGFWWPRARMQLQAPACFQGVCMNFATGVLRYLPVAAAIPLHPWHLLRCASALLTDRRCASSPASGHLPSSPVTATWGLASCATSTCRSLRSSSTTNTTSANKM